MVAYINLAFNDVILNDFGLQYTLFTSGHYHTIWYYIFLSTSSCCCSLLKSKKGCTVDFSPLFPSLPFFCTNVRKSTCSYHLPPAPSPFPLLVSFSVTTVRAEWNDLPLDSSSRSGSRRGKKERGCDDFHWKYFSPYTVDNRETRV